MFAIVVYNPARDYLLELNRRAQLILHEYIYEIDSEEELPSYRISEFNPSKTIPVPQQTHVEDIYGKTIFEDGKIPIVYISIRDDNGNLRHIDFATVILVHELAHLLQENSGHDEEFLQIENELLEIAYQLELIDRHINLDS